MKIIYYDTNNVSYYEKNIEILNHVEANNTAYSDRLYQFDSEKYNKLCEKHFGNQGQSFSNRHLVDIEKFLQDYIGNPNLILCSIEYLENRSNGNPYWRFEYKI